MEYTAKNVTNYVPSNYTITTLENFGRSPSANIYKRKSRKITYSMCRKSNPKISQNLPMYISQPKHALEKQNILFQIKKSKQKVAHQENLNKKLAKKLQKKQGQNYMAFSLTKENFFKTTQQQKYNLPLSYNFKASQVHKKNLQTSINQQMFHLNEEMQKNNMEIEKIKKSKKYTKFIEASQQKKACLNQLKELKEKLKMMKSEIIKKKRLNREVRKRKIDVLVMEGQFQDNLQKKNIYIYRQIQETNELNRQTELKKIRLKEKKKRLLKELQIMRKNFYQHKNMAHSKKSTAVTNIDYWNPYATGLQQLKEQSEEDESFLSRKLAQKAKINTFDKKSQFRPLTKGQRKFQIQDFQGISKEQIQKMQRKYFNNLQGQQEQQSSQNQQQNEQDYYEQSDFEQSEIQHKPSFKQIAKRVLTPKLEKYRDQRVVSV